jgi:hypothetical protein
MQHLWCIFEAEYLHEAKRVKVINKMDNHAKIKRSIRKIAQGSILVAQHFFSAQVDSVDGTVCTIKQGANYKP